MHVGGTEFLQEADAIVERGEPGGLGAGLESGEGVGVEGESDDAVAGVGDGAGAFQQGGVPEVHAVERPHRQDGSLGGQGGKGRWGGGSAERGRLNILARSESTH